MVARPSSSVNRAVLSSLSYQLPSTTTLVVKNTSELNQFGWIFLAASQAILRAVLFVLATTSSILLSFTLCSDQRVVISSFFPFSTTYCDHERAFPYCRLPLLEIFSWLVQSVQFISHPLEKLQRRKAKGFTDGIDRGDGGIPFSFYDSTDIAILQIRKIREGRFGHLSFFSDFFDCNASGFQ